MSIVLDEEHLNELVSLLGGGELEGIIDTFEAHSKDLISKILDCCRQNNQQETAILVHSLKGCCRNIGALSLASQCEVLELKAKNSELDIVARNLDHLEKELVLNVAAIESFAGIERH